TDQGVACNKQKSGQSLTMPAFCSSAVRVELFRSIEGVCGGRPDDGGRRRGGSCRRRLGPPGPSEIDTPGAAIGEQGARSNAPTGFLGERFDHGLRDVLTKQLGEHLSDHLQWGAILDPLQLRDHELQILEVKTLIIESARPAIREYVLLAP